MNGLIYYHRLRYPAIYLYGDESTRVAVLMSELALPFGKYHGWRLSAVAATDPDYCRWLSKQPFVQREFPMLYDALKSLTLSPGGIRVVRVTRRTLGSCEVYTFPAERVVRRHPQFCNQE